MSLDDVLRRILMANLATLRQRIDEVADAAEALADGRLSDERRTGAHRAAHQLNGTLGTLGIVDATAPAEALELLFDPDGAPLTASDGERARTMAATMRAALDAAVA